MRKKEHYNSSFTPTKLSLTHHQVITSLGSHFVFESFLQYTCTADSTLASPYLQSPTLVLLYPTSSLWQVLQRFCPSYRGPSTMPVYACVTRPSTSLSFAHAHNKLSRAICAHPASEAEGGATTSSIASASASASGQEEAEEEAEKLLQARVCWWEHGWWAGGQRVSA